MRRQGFDDRSGRYYRSASITLSIIEIVWGRMASCAAVGNRRRFALKTRQAD